MVKDLKKKKKKEKMNANSKAQGLLSFVVPVEVYENFLLKLSMQLLRKVIAGVSPVRNVS